MSSKHTPGPWSYKQGERPNFFYVESLSGDVVYVSGALQPAHVESNARLIAAAPELLEALQTMVEECKYTVMEASALDHAVEAIAKATGEA